MITPIEFIAALRDIYPSRYAEQSGGCLKFHRLMKAVFPESTGYYNSSHVITEIDGDFFDIDGQVEDLAGYIPIKEFGAEHLQASFPHILHLDDN